MTANDWILGICLIGLALLWFRMVVLPSLTGTENQGRESQ